MIKYKYNYQDAIMTQQPFRNFAEVAEVAEFKPRYPYKDDQMDDQMYDQSNDFEEEEEEDDYYGGFASGGFSQDYPQVKKDPIKEIIARNKAIYRKLGVELTNEQASGAELVRFGGKTGYLDGDGKIGMPIDAKIIPFHPRLQGVPKKGTRLKYINYFN